MTQDDDGAKVNDKEDALWSPRVEYSGLAGGGNGRRKIEKNDEYKEWMTPTKKKKKNSDTGSVCMYVRMYVHVCTYVCMYVCMYVFIYVCIYICMYAYTHIFTTIHTSAYICSLHISSLDTYGISRNKPKPKTAKQRLGKLLGLDRTGHFLRK